MKKHLVSVSLGILVFAVFSVQAQIPRTISFQGVLSTLQGSPKPDGTYSLTFRLYDVSDNGTAIWTEQKTLSVKKGLFSTQLGDQVLFGSSVKFDKPYWLSVQVANEAEGSPRIPLSASAYSLNASSADVAASVKDGSITSAKFATGQVVKSINQLKDDISLIPGTNITITPSTNSLIISSSATGGVSGSGAAGRVAFWNGASGLESDPALYWDKSTHRLGVGTSTPTSPLHIETSAGSALLGSTLAATGAVIGVTGATSSTSGFGVVGASSASTGNTVGVSGLALSSSGVGVGGYASSKSGPTDGVSGEVESPTGNGVHGQNHSLTGLANGVYGSSESGGGVGVYGFVGSGSGLTIGLSGLSMSSSFGTGVYGVGFSSSGTNYGVTGASNSYSGYGVYGTNFAGGIAIHCNGSFYQHGGTFQASPTSTFWTTNKPATVKLSDGSTAKLFAEEAAEVYFTDYGELRLSNGRAHVELDQKFLQTITVNDKYPMKVFIQVENECMGVYVTNKSTTGFDVVELQRGTSNAQFSYRVVCKRKHYEGERLAGVDEDAQFNRDMLKLAWPELVANEEAERAIVSALAEHGVKAEKAAKEMDAIRRNSARQNEIQK